MKINELCDVNTTACSISANGYEFKVIYGKVNGNGFIAIPNWGICTEASSPSDVFYNKEQLQNCNCSVVNNCAKDIALAIKEFYS